VEDEVDPVDRFAHGRPAAQVSLDDLDPAGERLEAFLPAGREIVEDADAVSFREQLLDQV
jgi:hypothetical protein